MTLFLIVILSLALLFIAGWYATHEGLAIDEPEPAQKPETTPIADQLDWDFGVLEKMSLPELLEYLRKRVK